MKKVMKKGMKNIHICIAVSLIFALLSCEDSQVSNDVQTPLPLQVLALDPELAGAIVYEDINEDGILNASENFAFTDADGYVTYNPVNSVNYCAISIEHRHCFRLLFPQATIRVVKGYDIRSKGQNTAQMSLRYTATSNDLDSVVVSPLSSVPILNVANDSNFVELSSETDKNNYVTALGLNAAVSVISEILSERYPEVGNTNNLPADFGTYVYQAVNNLLENQTISNINQLTSADVNNIVTASTAIIDVAYQRAGYTPAIVLDLASDKISTISQNIEALSTVVATLTNSGSTAVLVVATPQIVESLVVKATANNTSTFQSNADFATSDTAVVAGTSQTLVELLSDENNLANTSRLASDNFDSLSMSGVVLDNVAKFPALANKRLDLSVGGNGVSARIILDFMVDAGGPTDSGNFDVCVRYQDSSTPDLNTTGSLLNGSWALQTPNQLVGYITFVGTEFSIRIIRNSATEYQLDYGGELRNWENPVSLADSPSESVASESACQQLLQ